MKGELREKTENEKKEKNKIENHLEKYRRRKEIFKLINL